MTATTLQQLADGVVALGQTPGVAIAVVEGDGTLATAAAGVADLATRAPVDAATTLFEAGSIGKSFTAIVTLQLVEEGLLDLHAPLVDVLPWFRVRSRFAPITLHHLLCHTAGIVAGAEISTAAPLFEVMALADTEASLPPGARFRYSNVGYRAIGLALERVTGQPYGALVQERILDRLGLVATVPVLVNDDRRRIATTHVPWFDDRPFRPGHGHRAAPWIESAEADGSIAASACDLARYLRHLMDGAPALLAPASYALLTTAHTVDDDRGGYGYGLGLEGGVGHTGGMIGASAMMASSRADDRGAVVLANAPWATIWPSDIAAAALAIARGEPAEVPVVPPAEPLVDDGSCPPTLAPLRGVYRSFNAWQPRVRVVGRDGGLVLAAGGASDVADGALTPLPAGGFRLGDAGSPERVTFDTWLDGAPQRLVLSGAAYHRAGIVAPGADTA